MEKEICRRESTKAKNWCKVAMMISLVYAGVAFLFAFIFGAGNKDLFTEEWLMGLYWIAWGNMLLGLLLAGIFALLDKIFAASCALVLTDKRIYLSVTKKKFFKRTVTFTENYNLSKINAYDFVSITKGKRSYPQWLLKIIKLRTEEISYSELLIKTSSGQTNFLVDKEFYNQFVDAVNNAV